MLVAFIYSMSDNPELASLFAMMQAEITIGKSGLAIFWKKSKKQYISTASIGNSNIGERLMEH